MKTDTSGKQIGCCMCFYFSLLNQRGGGSCHRFPQVVEKYDDEWCGEFKRTKVKKQATREGAES